MQNNQIGSMGVRFCSSCEYNLKCSECVIKHKHEAVLEKYDALVKQLEATREEKCRLEHSLKERTCELNELAEKLSIIEAKIKTGGLIEL